MEANGNSRKARGFTIEKDNTKKTNQTGQQQFDSKLSSQKERRERAKIRTKKKPLIIEKEDYTLDNYLTNNKITGS
jgi:hypothetical protein